MAEMTIRLIPDPATGKKNIVIALRSDADALPHEHEQMHRRLVEKLVNGGLLKAEEVGQIVVEREEKEKAPAAPVEAGPQGETAGAEAGWVNPSNVSFPSSAWERDGPNRRNQKLYPTTAVSPRIR